MSRVQRLQELFNRGTGEYIWTDFVAFSKLDLTPYAFQWREGDSTSCLQKFVWLQNLAPPTLTLAVLLATYFQPLFLYSVSTVSISSFKCLPPDWVKADTPVWTAPSHHVILPTIPSPTPMTVPTDFICKEQILPMFAISYLEQVSSGLEERLLLWTMALLMLKDLEVWIRV